jgi:hypothetical protein
MLKDYIVLGFLFLAFIFFIYGYTSLGKAKALRKVVENQREKLIDMVSWVKAMDEISDSGKTPSISLLSIVERASGEVGLSLNSVKPSRDEEREAIEVTVRKIPTEDLIRFLWELEKGGQNITVVKLKIKRNFSEREYIDAEMKIARM